MGRVTKKTGTRKTKQQAPEAWKEPVEASEALDDEGEDGEDGTGVEHDGAGPVYVEKLTAEQLAQVADDLSERLFTIAKLEQDQRDANGAYRKKLKKLREERDRLRDEHRSGKRKVGAQRGLPGVAP